MSDRRAMGPFDTRLAGRIRAYTDRAIERRIDPLAMSRSAMASKRATGSSLDRLRAGSLGRRFEFADPRWAIGVVAVALIGVVGVAVVGRLTLAGVGPQPTAAAPSTPGPAASASGPVPGVLRHAWQRPYPVTPGLDRWGTGFLSLDGGLVGVRPAEDAAASRSAAAAGGPDTLVVTATAETTGCEIGAVGAYRWSVEGNGTVMTLTAIGTDPCRAREDALAGQWVRSDLPLPRDDGTPLPPGTYRTSGFDPFDRPGASGQLSYTVPEGWKVKVDEGATFVLHHVPDAAAGQSSTDSFVALLAHPRLAAAPADGATCGPAGSAPGVGGGLDDLLAAIMARPGVASSPPAGVTIGGDEGRLLDLRLETSWTGWCLAPEGRIVGLPILVEAGTAPGPVVGLRPDHPVRLILLDLGGGRTLAIVIYELDPSVPARFDALVADAMPIVESFEFPPPTP